MTNNQQLITNIDRAIHELCAGRMVEIDGQNYIHPEFINDANWDEISKQNPQLIITAMRASKIFDKDFNKPVTINISGKNIDEISALISGFVKMQNIKAKNSDIIAPLKLASFAYLLPTMVAVDGSYDAIKINSDDILNFKSEINNNLELVTDTKLNLKYAKNEAYIKAFRPANGRSEHLAIIIGKPSSEPMIRVHSSCYTGDLLGSLACDCGDQLAECIKLMDASSGGIILYLMQEGRGIGLINKLRAYNLQYDGMDTVEANEFLGFDDEEREFEPAVLMLKKLGISAVSLVTNNPKKAKGLEELGIKVKELIPLIISHEHNHGYLQTKAAKSGHLIDKS